MRLSRSDALRRLLIPLIAKYGDIDVSIRHPYTGGKLFLNLFMHKGYWFHGRHRAEDAMRSLARVIRPNDVVFDVGGHIAFMAQYFAYLVGDQGNVVVFEPGVNNLVYTRRNLSSLANARLVPKALTDHVGREILYLEDLSGQNNTLLKHFAAFEHKVEKAFVSVGYREMEVDVTSIEVFVQEEGVVPYFIKIDVEGAELNVLMGAGRVIDEARPAFLVEVNEGCHEPEIYDFFFAHGYRIFDVKLREILRYSGHITDDIFCVHHARTQHINLLR